MMAEPGCLTVLSSPSPQDTLSRSMDQVYTAVQHTRTSMKQLQRDHTHSLEHIARLQLQLQQGQDHIRKLEAQLAPGQDPVAHLEAQLVCSVDKDQDWQNEKPDRPKVRPQGSERGTRHQRINRPNPVLPVPSHGPALPERTICVLRELELQRSASHRYSLTAAVHAGTHCQCHVPQLRSQGGAQLTATTEQLRALNHTVDLLLTHSQQVTTHAAGTQMQKHTYAAGPHAHAHTHTRTLTRLSVTGSQSGLSGNSGLWFGAAVPQFS